MKYKFIEDTEFAFGKFNKGDIIEYDNEINAWTYTATAEDVYTSVCLSESIVSTWVDEKRIIPVSDENSCCNCCNCKCQKIESVKDEVDKLLATYEKNYNELIEQYNEGDVPSCVKVEAETVYFNLTKVLKTIKELLDE